MNAALRRDADVILRSSLNAVLPDEAVRRALRDLRPGKGRVLLVAAGKAAWQMAHAAVETLGRVALCREGQAQSSAFGRH